MTTPDMIALGSAIVSFLSLLAAIFYARKAEGSSRKAEAQAERANIIAIGQAETSMRENTALARQRIDAAAIHMEEVLQGRTRDKLKADENRRLDLLEKIFASAVEGYLNAYEDACGKYIDQKIDRVRFKKVYVKEIENLCDPKVVSYARLMHPADTSHYEAIWKVYREWHQYEK